MVWIGRDPKHLPVPTPCITEVGTNGLESEEGGVGELEGKVTGMYFPNLLHWAFLGSGRRRSSPVQCFHAASRGMGCGIGPKALPRLQEHWWGWAWAEAGLGSPQASCDIPGSSPCSPSPLGFGGPSSHSVPTLPG